MSNYKKRSDGRYYTTIPTNELDANGKKIRVPVYGYTIKEFEANKDEVKAKLRLGVYTNDRHTLFSDYKNQWYTTYVQNTSLSHNRKTAYGNLIKNHTKKLDGLELGMIKKSHVQESYNDLNGHAALQHEFKITVNQIFKCAIDDNMISKNPAANITIAKAKRDKVKNRALTKVERDAIKKADFTLMEKCFVLMLQYAGPRRGEILALTKSDIDFEKGLININKAIEFIGERPNLKNTKTFKGERKIDILKPLKSTLREYAMSTDTVILFPNSDGTIMSKTQYRRFFEQVRIKVNTAAGGNHKIVKATPCSKMKRKLIFPLDMCKNLSAKAFRHEYATILYYSGVDLLEAIRLFGHEDSRTLTDIYAELREEESNSKDKLNEYLDKRYG